MTDKESDTGRFYTNYRFEYPKENVVVATSSFQDVPSNKKPLINLTMNGILRLSEEKVHEIKMIFDGDVPEKDTCAESYGTFVLGREVYNARKIIKTLWDKENSTLTIIIDLIKERLRLTRTAQFSFSIQINDSTACEYTFKSPGGCLRTYNIKCTNPTTHCCVANDPAGKFTKNGNLIVFSGACKSKVGLRPGECEGQIGPRCCKNPDCSPD